MFSLQRRVRKHQPGPSKPESTPRRDTAIETRRSASCVRMAKKETGTVTLSKSEQMSRVRSRDTKPELLVRRLLSSLGVRYRLHQRDLPGRPDLYVGRLRLAVFVNGCFWHGHDCPRAGQSKTNADFWKQKIARNVARDRQALERLKEMGVQTLILWTCETAGFSAACRDLARRYNKAAR